MKPLLEYTKKNFIRRIRSADKYHAIEQLALAFKGFNICDDIDELIRALIEREKKMSTGIGFNIAIPHARLNSVKDMAFAIGISAKGIDFDSIDNRPVHLIILVAAGEDQHNEYLKLLSNIMNILKIDNVKKNIIKAPSSDKVLKILMENMGNNT